MKPTIEGLLILALSVACVIFAITLIVRLDEMNKPLTGLFLLLLDAILWLLLRRWQIIQSIRWLRLHS